jgi:cysteine-rich repeat protein
MFENLKFYLVHRKRKILLILGAVFFVGILIFYVPGLMANLFSVCGNNKIEGSEQCDDGNLINGDGCSSTCQTTCGDGIRAGSELCDDGAKNGASGDGCSSTCQTTCGDGIVAGFEQCDDGNLINGDGCSSKCLTGPITLPVRLKPNLKPSAPVHPANEAVPAIAPSVSPLASIPSGVSTCGDGVVDKKIGEVCEPDKFGENCPYGQTKPCKVCMDCKTLVPGINSFCGDGKVDPLNGEECDLGKRCSDQTICATDEDCKGIGNGLCSSPLNGGCSNQCKNEKTAASQPAASPVGEAVSTAIPPGTWSISVVKPNPEPVRVLTAGASRQKLASYLLTAQQERFTLNTLTIINDLTGAFDAKEDAPAIKEVIVECSSAKGGMVRASGPLDKGALTVSNFNCNVANNAPATLDIYVTLMPQLPVGPSFYGQTIRLGIQDPGSAQNTAIFDASGAISKASVNPQWVNAESIEPFMIRKAVPAFANASDLNSALSIGENDLYKLTVTASKSDPVSLAGLTFQVSVSQPTSTALNKFRLIKVDSLMKSIEADANLFSERGDVGVGSNNSFSGGLVGVSFNTEESIPAGESRTYTLMAMVNGTLKPGAGVTTQPLGDSDFLTLSNSCGPNASMGKLYDTNGSAIFGLDGEFSFANRSKARVIWSDGSAPTHLYPTVKKGIVIAGSGSCDWTNGWGLGIEQLEPHILVQ